ncbi:MAG: glycosyltransferase family 4 protein [bacterium]|nr:glycosyltransferase family 4 protein [bacterium]
MKILIATGLYPPDIGGPATYSKLLKEELPKRDIDVEVLSFGDVRHLPKPLSHVRYFTKLLRLAPFADVIYAQDPVSVGFPALLAAVFLRKKFVLKVVGDYAWEQGTARYGIAVSLDEFSKEHRGYPFFVRVLKTVEALVARSADTIIVPSKYLKKIVGNWGISKEKIVVVYNAYTGEPGGSKDATPHAPSEEKVIVSAGRLVPWKGFVTLISLMRELVKHFPGAKLIIVGDGPERSMLESNITRLGLQSNVFLTGALPQEKLFKYIRNADVFVLNTSYEGFSHQLLEVLAIGTPVVTTDVGGNPEIIKDGENGLLVAPDDRAALIRAIERVILDDDLAKRFFVNGRKTVAEFSVDRMLKETIEAISL